MESKQCIACKLFFPYEMYDFASNDNKYYRKKCKKCRLDDIHKCREKIKKKEKIDITIKICIKCNQEKSSSEFYKKSLSHDGYNTCCKLCCKKVKTENKINTIVNKIYCSKCNTYKDNSEFRSTSRSKTGYFTTCNACWAPSNWTKEKQYASEKKYVANNIEKIREKWKKQGQNINRRLRNNNNKRISQMLQSNGTYKKNKTIIYLGCNIEYLKKWFSFLFEDNMTWDNYGDWHIDHVVPCTTFNLVEDSEQKSVLFGPI